jgi:hypothetical protein
LLYREFFSTVLPVYERLSLPGVTELALLGQDVRAVEISEVAAEP